MIIDISQQDTPNIIVHEASLSYISRFETFSLVSIIVLIILLIVIALFSHLIIKLNTMILFLIAWLIYGVSGLYLIFVIIHLYLLRSFSANENFIYEN